MATAYSKFLIGNPRRAWVEPYAAKKLLGYGRWPYSAILLKTLVILAVALFVIATITTVLGQGSSKGIFAIPLFFCSLSLAWLVSTMPAVVKIEPEHIVKMVGGQEVDRLALHDIATITFAGTPRWGNRYAYC